MNTKGMKKITIIMAVLVALGVQTVNAQSYDKSIDIARTKSMWVGAVEYYVDGELDHKMYYLGGRNHEYQYIVDTWIMIWTEDPSDINDFLNEIEKFAEMEGKDISMNYDADLRIELQRLFGIKYIVLSGENEFTNITRKELSKLKKKLAKTVGGLEILGK